MPQNKNGSEKNPLVLIVDDVETNIQVLANLLSDHSYHIAFATSGEQALTMVKELEPDLILLDIMMPGMDGIEVCRSLRRMDVTRETPVIFLTARTETDDIVRGFEAGAQDYVTKPFQGVELLARVKTHMELKAARETRDLLILELREALDRVRLLSGLLPICSYCKMIRDDRGYWTQVEEYISKHSDATFSHGICPNCAEKHFPFLSQDTPQDPPE